MATLISKQISIPIQNTAKKVYAFASNPKNLPKWASGLGRPIKKIGGKWIANSPMGKIAIQFAQKNTFGVLDHKVTLSSGKKFSNPMRVFPNKDGSEVVFTLYRQPRMSDNEFRKDAKWIENDLKKLKKLMEK